jgi:serine/threonine-protein kinase
MIEGFRVLAEVGRGAASIIYLVQDPKTKQIWALKHVEKETDKDQRFLDQAEEEYKIASRIKSPTIRKIERLIRKREGLLSTSELYLVMEHVDGSSLEREPPVTFADAVYICEQVAQGLAEMHKEGYVHADMKPNNVIVTSNLTAKIIDLGQSCKIGTVKQRIQGTPDYIAPEQVHRRAITPKTDVYNLGATMYWIFTRSFVPTALTGKSDSLVQGLEEAFIPKPKKVSEFNPRVPEMLEALVMQCVETNPDDRPTMEQVAERLNLIRGKLSAESIMRRTATPTTDEARA